MLWPAGAPSHHHLDLNLQVRGGMVQRHFGLRRCDRCEDRHVQAVVLRAGPIDRLGRMAVRSLGSPGPATRPWQGRGAAASARTTIRRAPKRRPCQPASPRRARVWSIYWSTIQWFEHHRHDRGWRSTRSTSGHHRRTTRWSSAAPLAMLITVTKMPPVQVLGDGAEKHQIGTDDPGTSHAASPTTWFGPGGCRQKSLEPRRGRGSGQVRAP